MKISKSAVLKSAAISAAAVMFLAGCFGGSGGDKSANAVNYVKVNTTRSGMSLIPQDSVELASFRMLNMLYSGLIHVTPEGKIENEMAKSIETADNRVWRITLRDDFKFTNGEQVTAKSFINAWNYAAKLSNAMGNRDHLQNIEGFTEKGDTDLSGLKLIGDYEFEIHLKEVNRNFLANLYSTVYYPLPEAAYKDMKNYGQNPIGNGPYKFVSYLPGVELKMVKNPDYKGPRKPKNDGLHYQVYANTTAAYSDVLGGNLDVLDDLPADALAKFKTDLPNQYAQNPAAQTWYLVIPVDVPHFGMDEEGVLRRKALSMALDRKEIGERIFYGVRTPAREFTAPMLLSYKTDIPGNEVLEQNVAKAKELWEQANAISPWNAEDTLYLNYATDRGDKPMYEAMVYSIKDALGINAEAYANPDWKTNLERGSKNKQPFRLSWTADWPAPDNFLFTLFSSNGAGNFAKFSDPEFDRLATLGDASLDDAQALENYTKAQEILLNKLPVIPLFYDNDTLVWSGKVKGARGDWMGLPVYYEIEKK